jgi:hypothetical protein
MYTPGDGLGGGYGGGEKLLWGEYAIFEYG